MISARQARELLGVSRTLWDSLRRNFTPIQYNKKLFYKRDEIQNFIERHRKPVQMHGKLMNLEISTWF